MAILAISDNDLISLIRFRVLILDCVPTLNLFINLAFLFPIDAGAYDIAYWNEHSTNNDHFAGDLPGSLSGIAASNLGQTSGAKLKPYIAFRNEV